MNVISSSTGNKGAGLLATPTNIPPELLMIDTVRMTEGGERERGGGRERGKEREREKGGRKGEREREGERERSELYIVFMCQRLILVTRMHVHTLN